MQHSFVLYTLLMALVSTWMLKPTFSIPHQNEKEGVINYLPKGKFEGRVVPLHYYIPKGAFDQLKCQIILHGASRNADEYIAVWKEFAEANNLVLLAPEFSEEHFKISEYTQGMMFLQGTQAMDPDANLFKLLDEMFKWFMDSNALPLQHFNLFGHSAGGQFVHRSLLFHQSPYLKSAVAANPGWYTYPTSDWKYPYGVDGLINFDPHKNVEKYFQKNLTIALGTADTLRTGKLRITKEADEQGFTRLERGLQYFEKNKGHAHSRNLAFNWSIFEVEGAGHDHALMSPAAFHWLYQKDNK